MEYPDTLDNIGYYPSDNYKFVPDPEFVKMCEQIVDNILSARRPPEQKSNFYEITLTTAGDDPQKLVDSMYKIVESKMTPVAKSWKACLELTAAKKPHIHMLYETEGVVLPSRIKKLFKERFSCSKVRNLQAFEEYIKKEESNIDVINYCKLKECQQFYSNG